MMFLQLSDKELCPAGIWHARAINWCLALQAELLQQAAVNRPRLFSVLEKAAADVPGRQAQAEKQMWSEEYVQAYMLVRFWNVKRVQLSFRLSP